MSKQDIRKIKYEAAYKYSNCCRVDESTYEKILGQKPADKNAFNKYSAERRKLFNQIVILASHM